MALINGVNYSWGNLAVVIFGNVTIGITEISYKRKQEKTNNYGAGNEPISRGYGRVEYEGSITMYVDEWKRIIQAAISQGINSPLEISASDMQVVYAGSRVLPSTDKIESFEFLEDPFDGKEGDTKFMVTIPIIIGGLTKGGI